MFFIAEEILNAKDLSGFLKYDYSKHSFNLVVVVVVVLVYELIAVL